MCLGGGGGGGVKESEGGRVSLKGRCDCFVMLLLFRCQLTRVRLVMLLRSTMLSMCRKSQTSSTTTATT